MFNHQLWRYRKNEETIVNCVGCWRYRLGVRSELQRRCVGWYRGRGSRSLSLLWVRLRLSIPLLWICLSVLVWTRFLLVSRSSDVFFPSVAARAVSALAISAGNLLSHWRVQSPSVLFLRGRDRSGGRSRWRSVLEFFLQTLLKRW